MFSTMTEDEHSKMTSVPPNLVETADVMPMPDGAKLDESILLEADGGFTASTKANANLPDPVVDWRTKGAVNAIKN